MKKYLLIIFIICFALIVNGCSGNGDKNITIIEEFVGSGGPGDFYKVDINITDKEYSYQNLTTNNDSGSGEFDLLDVSGNSGVYSMDTGDLFVKLNDELIIVTNSGCEPGERLIAALKEADTAYGNDIDGTYNLATSMEGAIGEVTIDSSSNSADINIDLNGDGDYNDSEEKLYNLPYVFNNEYKAIKLIESNEFKHYGVFVNNDISVWDSYYWNGENWQGDGMSIMVRKNTSLSLSNCTGEYNYVDVDGDTGTYELVNIGNNDTELQFIVDNQNTGITITDSDIDNRGIINISADLVEPEGENENWYMMVLPNKIMIIASANDNAFSGDGGFAIGVKK